MKCIPSHHLRLPQVPNILIVLVEVSTFLSRASIPSRWPETCLERELLCDVSNDGRQMFLSPLSVNSSTPMPINGLFSISAMADAAKTVDMHDSISLKICGESYLASLCVMRRWLSFDSRQKVVLQIIAQEAYANNFVDMHDSISLKICGESYLASHCSRCYKHSRYACC